MTRHEHEASEAERGSRETADKDLRARTGTRAAASEIMQVRKEPVYLSLIVWLAHILSIGLLCFVVFRFGRLNAFFKPLLVLLSLAQIGRRNGNGRAARWLSRRASRRQYPFAAVPFFSYMVFRPSCSLFTGV